MFSPPILRMARFADDCEQTFKKGRIMSGENHSNTTRMLRHISTRQYFTGDGWTGDAMEAKLFHDTGEVVRICIERGLRNVELALRLSPTGPDLFCATVR